MESSNHATDVPSPLVVFLYRVYVKLTGWLYPRRTALTFFGCEFNCDVRDHLQKRIYFFKTWEPELSSFMIERLRPGDVAVDVGGNVGYFTTLMSRLVGRDGRVVSVEASLPTFELLKETVTRNQCENVTAVNVAVSDRKGQVDLFRSPSDGRNLGMVAVRKRTDSIKVCTVDCDRFFDIIGDLAGDVSFVKVDIEGAERPLLEDILARKDTLKRPFTLVAEISLSNRELISDFASAGFKCAFLRNNYDFAFYMTCSRGGKSRHYHKLEEIPNSPFGEIEGDFVFILE